MCVYFPQPRMHVGRMGTLWYSYNCLATTTPHNMADKVILMEMMEMFYISLNTDLTAVCYHTSSCKDILRTTVGPLW